MSEQEAIRILHPDTTREALAEINDYEAMVKAVDDACLMGCKALEKQIPKKPKIKGDFLLLAYCQVCEKTIGFKQEYCHRCGNAIDWGEEE